MRSLPTAALLSLALMAGVAHAEYMQPQLEQVPLARLIENLEARLEQRPDDAERLHALARVHAMAYARGIGDEDQVRVYSGREERGMWLGYEPSRLPFGQVQEPGSAEARRAAEAHLETALDLYARAREAAPDDWVIRLGEAWCLAQTDQRDLAVERLREILADSWEAEGDQRYGDLGEFVTVEAGTYLISLLDAEDDADEIRDVRAKIRHLQNLPRPITPLAVPLRAGLGPDDLIDRQARVTFDLDGTGRVQTWQWITADAAWLVYDPGHTGRVDSALQLFGNRTFNLFHTDGYQALDLLDDDGDGWLRGDELSDLALWSDANLDGVSDPGEVSPLTEHGVGGLSCRAEDHPDGIRWSPVGVELTDGSLLPSFDLVLDPRP
jgi:tetratricopeptide (TPR) repeat protein